MLYIALPDKQVRRLSFYLAMEEYVARQVEADDCFFMWQVEPTVIFGRNQQMENEVNIAYCQQHGIQVVQRKSGGGCVYADMDNIMLSYISSETHVGQAFNRFINMLLLLFRKMGIEAVGTTHNDIMIGDRKVCGTACYHLSGRNIIHSTLLYDTNMENMLNAITPGVEKLEAKGIFQREHALVNPVQVDDVCLLKFSNTRNVCSCIGDINIKEMLTTTS